MPALSTTSSVAGAYGTSDPTVSHDGPNGWAVNDTYLNTATGVLWVLQSAAAGAAVWNPVPRGLIGKLIGANFNVTTDNTIPVTVPTGLKYRLTKVTVKNASISLTTAAGGLYTAASKGGTVVVLAAQAYSALTAATIALDTAIVAGPAATVYDPATQASFFLNLTTAQGAAATADVYLFGDVYF